MLWLYFILYTSSRHTIDKVSDCVKHFSTFIFARFECSIQELDGVALQITDPKCDIFTVI